ncbi:MAG: geranylgeranylglyceryl/heptaprenylglyceryl phosphate synthase [Bacteroidia bacterium]|nr:geranylgeranylglyceryl/heptaprenylglyceryl phosphate synthase [Bacteroidia bacterium]
MPGPLLDFLIQFKRDKRKAFAMLIDPDKCTPGEGAQIGRAAAEAGVDFFLVGGSLVSTDGWGELVRQLKEHSGLPAILFPGSVQQINPEADGILFLSLLSGRNPELLIGQHVIAAPLLKRSKLEVLATAYLLVDGGRDTTVHYMSNTRPIPYDKPDIAACTALAGEYLGMSLVYMDCGSGAHQAVHPSMVAKVSQEISVPLIVGGGIRSGDMAGDIWEAGADIVVVGNALERDPSGALLREIAAVKAEKNRHKTL